MSAPTPEEQLEFLVQIQRLLNESAFTASYKYALLLAISDLCVECGDDSGEVMIVRVDDFAEKFIAYYWRQSLPYLYKTAGGERSVVLKQSTGKQATVVQRIESAHTVTGGSLARAKANPALWFELVADVARTIKKDVLWRLQRVGRQVTDFLYPNSKSGRIVHLRPGVSFCFRRFHQLIGDLVRGAWVRFVRGLKGNQIVLEQTTNLDEFMFGSEREPLSAYRPILGAIQSGRCFYCEQRLGSNAEVDHFVSWSRYPVDLGHNFVLADPSCNKRKRDRLASYEHLKKWCHRNVEHRELLAHEFDAIGVVHDAGASARIVRWAYGQAALSHAHVWQRSEQLVPLESAWAELPGMSA